MPEDNDLTTGPEEMDAEFVFQSDSEYLTGAINALEMIEQMDTAILSEARRRQCRKAKKQSLDIVFLIIDQWHQELFDKEDDED